MDLIEEVSKFGVLIGVQIAKLKIQGLAWKWRQNAGVQLQFN